MEHRRIQYEALSHWISKSLYCEAGSRVYQSARYTFDIPTLSKRMSALRSRSAPHQRQHEGVTESWHRNRRIRLARGPR